MIGSLTAPPIVSREAGLSADMIKQAFAVEWQHSASHNAANKLF